jgi:integrase
VVKNVGPLRAMFATALEDGLALPRNPCVGLRINRRRAGAEEQPDKPKAMTREQLAHLLAELPERWLLLFELLAKTGLRISEALGLDWQDVEFGSQPRLRIRRQYYRGDVRQLKSTAGRRDLPLSAGLARRLWTTRPAGAAGPVFATRDGHRLQDRNVRRVLDRAGVDADLGWVHFHTFRHTFASLSFEAGKNIRQVSDWLGHTDPSFTLRTYVSLMDEGLGDADFLDEAVGTPEALIEREGTQDGAAVGGR